MTRAEVRAKKCYSLVPSPKAAYYRGRKILCEGRNNPFPHVKNSPHPSLETFGVV
jgi:hypothetical protein